MRYLRYNSLSKLVKFNISLDDIYCAAYASIMKRQMQLIPQVQLSILLALSLKERHGYEIIQQVKADSLGKINLGPAALYGSLAKLLELELISEVVENLNARRRCYQLTDKGVARLHDELEYLRNSVQLAEGRLVSIGRRTS